MKKITTGTENFKRIIDENYYYVDKSQFIEIALKDQFNLFIRPRRFGKTLNMSMLYYFLSHKEADNAYLFNHLMIAKNEEMMKLQNQFPVIYITLKGLKSSNFEDSIYAFKSVIRDVIDSYQNLLDSSEISDVYKSNLNDLYNQKATIANLIESLKLISYCLEKHYKQKVVILIDEYDVPLQAAYQYGYYEEMSNFISALFSAALKTNDSLFKGVMTGCLRIAKESIFTGLNNFSVYSIFDEKASNCFGFTQDEIDEILNYYQLNECKDHIKEWYDGYLFGNTEIYNPWSTLYYIDDLLVNIHKEASSYWANTSGNDIVYNYIKNGDLSMKEEFEMLAQGKSIIKHIIPELTYREMDDINNIYSFLLFTGYLKVKKALGNDIYELVIPNKEVKKIYENHFNQYFRDYTRDRKKEFVEALKNENIELASDILNDTLEHSISFYDNYESFYHGFMVGFLSGYIVKSNLEVGNGRFDIAILPISILKRCIVIECKKTENPMHLENDSLRAVKQIVDQRYIEGLKNEGYRDVVGYGISFYKKACCITKVTSS